MEFCEHTKHIGDNYGVDCEDCGETLAGFGYGGFLGRILKSQRSRCLQALIMASATSLCFCAI
jgi:hypothetical protein